MEGNAAEAGEQKAALFFSSKFRILDSMKPDGRAVEAGAQEQVGVPKSRLRDRRGQLTQAQFGSIGGNSNFLMHDLY